MHLHDYRKRASRLLKSEPQDHVGPVFNQFCPVPELRARDVGSAASSWRAGGGVGASKSGWLRRSHEKTFHVSQIFPGRIEGGDHVRNDDVVADEFAAGMMVMPAQGALLILDLPNEPPPHDPILRHGH